MSSTIMQVFLGTLSNSEKFAELKLGIIFLYSLVSFPPTLIKAKLYFSFFFFPPQVVFTIALIRVDFPVPVLSERIREKSRNLFKTFFYFFKNYEQKTSFSHFYLPSTKIDPKLASLSAGSVISSLLSSSSSSFPLFFCRFVLFRSLAGLFRFRGRSRAGSRLFFWHYGCCPRPNRWG